MYIDILRLACPRCPPSPFFPSLAASQLTVAHIAAHRGRCQEVDGCFGKGGRGGTIYYHLNGEELQLQQQPLELKLLTGTDN